LVNDLAVLILDQAVPELTPSPLYRQLPVRGQLLTLVGYGAGGTGHTGSQGDFGTKRVGTTRLDRVTSTQLWWNFNSNAESNTAPGDSGGPAFLLVDGVYHLAGVTSGGLKEDASLGDRSFDTRVDVFAEWIDEPHNRSSILIYRLTERGTTSDALATVSWRGRGYLVVDCAARLAISVTARQSGRQTSVVREDWPLATPLAQATIFTANQLYSVLAAQELAPAEGAWYQVAGKAHGQLAGQVYARTGKGESLRLADGCLTQASLTTRLDTRRSDALTDTDLATDVAAALVTELTPAAAAPARRSPPTCPPRRSRSTACPATSARKGSSAATGPASAATCCAIWASSAQPCCWSPPTAPAARSKPFRWTATGCWHCWVSWAARARGWSSLPATPRFTRTPGACLPARRVTAWPSGSRAVLWSSTTRT
jgi:hypothetical protein